jgi:hypothetical protein
MNSYVPTFFTGIQCNSTLASYLFLYVNCHVPTCFIGMHCVSMTLQSHLHRTCSSTSTVPQVHFSPSLRRRTYTEQLQLQWYHPFSYMLLEQFWLILKLHDDGSVRWKTHLKIKSIPVQTQQRSIYYIELHFQPISGHFQIQNWSLKHTEDEIYIVYVQWIRP